MFLVGEKTDRNIRDAILFTDTPEKAWPCSERCLDNLALLSILWLTSACECTTVCRWSVWLKLCNCLCVHIPYKLLPFASPHRQGITRADTVIKSTMVHLRNTFIVLHCISLSSISSWFMKAENPRKMERAKEMKNTEWKTEAKTEMKTGWKMEEWKLRGR